MAALLSSRRISSAVGMLAERHGISIDEAFNRLRNRARANRQRTEELAKGIISRQATPAEGRPRARARAYCRHDPQHQPSGGFRRPSHRALDSRWSGWALLPAGSKH
jgi:hypothetical protein